VTEERTATVVATFKIKIDPDYFHDDGTLDMSRQDEIEDEARSLIEDGVSFTSDIWEQIEDADYEVTRIGDETWHEPPQKGRAS